MLDGQLQRGLGHRQWEHRVDRQHGRHDGLDRGEHHCGHGLVDDRGSHHRWATPATTEGLEPVDRHRATGPVADVLAEDRCE